MHWHASGPPWSASKDRLRRSCSMSADVMVRFFWVVALMRLRLGESHGPKEWEPPARRTPRVACGSWVLDSRLVDAADPVILVNLSSHERYARYWSIVDAGASNASSERFVVARNGANRGAGVRPYSQLWSGCGATLGCAGAPGPLAKRRRRCWC